MFDHRVLRRIFIGATRDAFPIGKNQPLAQANFPDDVLGHFRASGSELIISYIDCVAGPLTLLLLDEFPEIKGRGSSVRMHVT
jgi:hypothetical protein